ncbi:cation-translocating P-type ATPase [Chryseobacterium carnipullorum]|uniref:Calcium-transporting ATPase lmo0841 n=1 Tax=Chryseobacterium carnipullorum TaxID=1124835 RepID=A0A376DYX8_CHRCU|nr:cation-translocating P-type ATPase [Chryseobacterium carnipullorum]AZA50314.1 cation-translocating P-type ATPase [Chryseobacterium carnipullorum]AZA65187.1 cation-translocating P-type ATPase [Chryseobacterium carnipullorum]STC98411.1 Calcium-transporting ATPase lmo0841 [Chryseobacterium carnipullorum]
MPIHHFNIQGLSDNEVIQSREKNGKNNLNYKKGNTFFETVIRIAKDPMLILLFVAAFIYFISGKNGDGIFLTVAIIFQTSISLYQYSRSKNALEKLKDLSQPNCKVIRNGKIIEIKSEDLVVGDSMMVEEGTLITADGSIIHSNDFSVNESILTGESLSVFKEKTIVDHFIYSGTTVASGLAVATITAIGNATRLGKIGSSLESITEEKTPLEKQIANFVKKMAITGTVVFMIVWIINYWHSQEVLNSLLQSLTLAMSILPEEIPVAFTTFMALGAWRLMKLGIVVKQMKTVETLGSATVICTDKTGTLTENKMSVAKLFLLSSNKIFLPADTSSDDEKELITSAMWASEPIAFDPMEIALHQTYENISKNDERPHYHLIHEYPLGGKPPMMTHIFSNRSGKRIIAAKGAPEALMAVSDLASNEKQYINKAIQLLAKDGFRVLGVGTSDFTGTEYPKKQQDLLFQFKGIIAFYDPPKKNIQKVLENFYNAGIAVKIITGDNSATTEAIARQIGFKGCKNSITGDELMRLEDDQLKESVMTNSIFTRMFPEAKLKIINALKSNHQIVAMTGDGVNDGPALKAAHIGIAMGRKGTEIAKQAASLILLEDDLSKMVDAIAMGRKIYTNLKKAIQFIISIHIPIILTVFIPLALGWIYPNIFSPIHIIFLELIMGPTCSIVYENEPMEKNTMTRKPKPFTSTFFNWKELSTSIIQGLVITVGTLWVYLFSVDQGFNEQITRTMVFLTLVTSNVFLTLENRSFYYSVITTLRYKNNLVLIIVGITVGITGLLLYVKPLTRFFAFEELNLIQFLIAAGTGCVSVLWYELVKFWKRHYQIM